MRIKSILNFIKDEIKGFYFETPNYYKYKTKNCRFISLCPVENKLMHCDMCIYRIKYYRKLKIVKCCMGPSIYNRLKAYFITNVIKRIQK